MQVAPEPSTVEMLRDLVLQEAGHPSPKMGLSHNQSTRQTGRFLNNPNLTHYRFYQPVVGQPELTMGFSKQMLGRFKSFVHSKR